MLVRLFFFPWAVFACFSHSFASTLRISHSVFVGRSPQSCFSSCGVFRGRYAWLNDSCMSQRSHHYGKTTWATEPSWYTYRLINIHMLHVILLVLSVSSLRLDISFIWHEVLICEQCYSLPPMFVFVNTEGFVRLSTDSSRWSEKNSERTDVLILDLTYQELM